MKREPHTPLTITEWDEMAQITTAHPQESEPSPVVFDVVTHVTAALVSLLFMVALAVAILR